MKDDPLALSEAIRIARKTMYVLWQNIVFSLGVKGIVLVLAALGIANMWMGVFADVGVTLLAVLNSMRILRMKKQYERCNQKNRLHLFPLSKQQDAKD